MRSFYRVISRAKLDTSMSEQLEVPQGWSAEDEPWAAFRLTLKRT